jgi:hypothetical protein
LILAAFPAIFSLRNTMAESTPLRDQETPRVAVSLGRPWAKLGRGIGHVFFWAYERGSWQYDLIVIAIVAFIFLTPRSWFSDRPTLQMTDLRHAQGIVEVSQSQGGHTYLVDARLVDSLAPLKPEEAVPSIVSTRVQRPFTVQSVDPVRDRNNVVLGYTVVVVFK